MERITAREFMIAKMKQRADVHAAVAQGYPELADWNLDQCRMLRACAAWLQAEGDLRQAPTEEGGKR